MKIAYNWLTEIISLEKSPQEMAVMLTGTGLEVEHVEKFQSIKGGLEGIVVGEVKTCIKHQNADKLSITTVNIGGETDIQIVCGATNVAVGQKVLVATVGSILHPIAGEPFKINKSKIRGEVSEGMICAEDELGLGNSHDGILVLPQEYIVGKNASSYFDIYTDYLIEIGLTANRGDAASHLGVARDLKALTGATINHPALNKSFSSITSSESPIGVTILDAEDCPRYSGISISGIDVKESPPWLQNKLRVIGISSINNIVDVTNYVLHAIGQPLHAFDADLIAGKKIIVKKAEAGTYFTTLDKTDRELTGNELMICDIEKPLAIAGVFGGLHSGITALTKNIFIESAYFNPSSIRKTAKIHGLSTDTSFRYERGTDPEITIDALKYAASLILEIAGGSVTSSIVDVYPKPIKPTSILFSIQRFYDLIGQQIAISIIKQILTRLDIKITQENTEILTLIVPAYRSDVTREADIAEEILRIYGLDNILIPSQVKSSISLSPDENNFNLKNKIASYLSNSGCSELVCNSLTKSSYYTQNELAAAVQMLNPLSSDLDILRLNMVYSGLEMIQYNNNRKQPNIKCYEFGKTYSIANGNYTESDHLAIFITGNKQPESWNQQSQSVSYFTIKTFTHHIFTLLGVSAKFQIQYNQEDNCLQSNTIITNNGKTLVKYGEVRPDITKLFDLNNPVYLADFEWNNILELTQIKTLKYKPISAYPQVRRDLALILDEKILYTDIERIALKIEPKLLQFINVFDVYQGEIIQQGKKSYALSFILQDEEKTLTDQEIEGVMKRLVRQYEKELGATLRT